jgi:hypothetical protein
MFTEAENSAPDPEVATEATPGRDRQCGRCQQTFAGEAGAHAVAQLGWWLCPPCREALIGHQPRGRS